MIKKISGVSSSVRSYILYLNRTNPNIIIFIAYGLLLDTVVNVWKPFAIKFLQLIDGNELHVSLFYSLPGIIAAISLLPGTLLIARIRNKKRITSILFFISRSILLVTAFVPVLPGGLRAIAFVGLISLMNFPDAVSQTSLQSFLGEIFNGRVRAQAISLRNKFGNVVVPVVTLVTGFIISFLPGNDAQRLVYYQIFFAIAFFVGLVEIFVFRKFKTDGPEDYSSSQQTASKPDYTVFKTILKDKKFMSFLASTLCFTFFWQAAWPLCSVYNIQVLGASEIWLALFTVASSIGAFTSAGFWNKHINRKGNSNALFLATVLLAGNLFVFAFVPNLPIMILVNFYSGFAVLGVNTSLLNGLLSSTPDENRVVYLGTYNVSANLSLFISPIAAHMLSESFGIRMAMLVIAAGRLLTSLLILLLRKQER